MTDPSALFELICCPRCAGRLRGDTTQCRCLDCQTEFPVIDKIPWLYDHAAAAVADWQASIKLHLQQLAGNATAIKDELKVPTLLASTRKRLLKQLQAYVEQKKCIERLLAAVIATESDSHGLIELSEALRNKPPKTQSLTGYYTNIHRDWAWDDEIPEHENENSLSFDLVARHLGSDMRGKTIAVLGGGACRLPYDIHRRCQPKQTIVLDINPLLSYAAKRLIAGQSVHLYEFPLAPRNADSYAIARRCKAPESLNGGMSFILADAMSPPFRRGSIDVVCTPWFIDIVPQDLRTFLPRIAAMLKPGGTWVNFGSLVFNHSHFSRRYSLEEVLEIAEQSGFVINSYETTVIPYMQSPASNHGRREEVIVFSATRKEDHAVISLGETPFSHVPNWLLDTSRPVPRDRAIETFQITHAAYADVASLIDGERPIEQIAQLFSEKHQMPFGETKQALVRFLASIYEQNQQGALVFR